MRGKVVRHLYLTEQEAYILSIFFNTVTNMVDNQKLDMTELLELISSNTEIYDKYGQFIQIHYND